MSDRPAPESADVHVEIDYRLTLVELCRASAAHEDEVRAWIDEGALAPDETIAGEWRFAATTLRRARTAARLAHDFEIDAPAVALVLGLMDEIERLKARLR
ncbi:MAG: MerR family transcriptional regulator [Burkholderiales bacterium]|nr:MerR family transcriptional regulator [Burkholderiales bacterium]